jgi:hypothetical protein
MIDLHPAIVERPAANHMTPHTRVISLARMVDQLTPHFLSKAHKISARLGFRRGDEIHHEYSVVEAAYRVRPRTGRCRPAGLWPSCELAMLWNQGGG